MPKISATSGATDINVEVPVVEPEPEPEPEPAVVEVGTAKAVVTVPASEPVAPKKASTISTDTPVTAGD